MVVFNMYFKGEKYENSKNTIKQIQIILIQGWKSLIYVEKQAYQPTNLKQKKLLK